MQSNGHLLPEDEGKNDYDQYQLHSIKYAHFVSFNQNEHYFILSCLDHSE